MDLFNDTHTHNLLPFQGEVNYFSHYFSKSESDEFLDLLVNDVPWKQEPIRIFGKEIMQPRMTALYGNPDIPYGYSGIQMQPMSWTPYLSDIKNKIESVAQIEFTHVLLNYYRDGQDSMGWHRDNEKVLGPNPTIGSVSFGAPRTFQLRNYQNKKIKKSILLEHGSFLLMKGETQHYWEHQIAKSKSIKQGRINLTFRAINPPNVSNSHIQLHPFGL